MVDGCGINVISRFFRSYIKENNKKKQTTHKRHYIQLDIYLTQNDTRTRL